MIKGLKLALWKIGLRPDRCPYCGEDLVKVGHLKGCYQHYRCPKEDCEFNVKRGAP